MNARNPQAEQMGDESMLRTLAAQAEAIWPQEHLLFDRYALRNDASVLDLGCGSGEITARLAARYPLASIIGVDILDHVVDIARARHAGLAPRVGFETGDAFALRFPDAQFDAVVCRHVVQSIPHVELALAEMLRVTKTGGWLHVLAEDYGMLRFPAGDPDPDRFWREVVVEFGVRTGVDPRIGRHIYPLLQELGLEQLRVDYITVDTERVARKTFAQIIEAWRDGYVDALAAQVGRAESDVRGNFDRIIASILDLQAYSVWQVPIWSGRKTQV